MFTRLMLGCLALLLFSPLSVSGPLPGDAELSVGLPAIHSGDEPHYLIQLHSILQDGDLDLANNYAAVHAGGVEAGRKFAGGALDHHVAWYRDGRLVQWWEAYEIDPAKWDRDAAGRPTPTRRADSTQLPVSDREYSQHAPGLPLLLAGVLWPVGGTALVEPLALTLAAAATCLGALSFFRLVRPYSSSLEWVLFVVIAAYLGSPLWHYGRTLYTEPFVAAMTVSAYAAVLRGRSYLLAGLLMGAAVLCKVPYLVIALPLAAAAAVERDWSGLWKFAAPMLAAMLVALWWNYTLRDGWWHMPARWLWSRPFVGIFGMLFSPRHGLLLFTPVVLLAIASTPEWWRRHRRDALVIGGGVLSHFLLMSSYEQWWGGHAYSSRYFVAVLPLAFVPLAMLRDSAMWRERPAVKWAAGVIVLLSIGMNLIAAYACEHVWDRHPLELVVSRW